MPWGTFNLIWKNNKVFVDYICDYQDNPAVKAGFQVGDEVLSINGIKLDSDYDEDDAEKLAQAEIWEHIIKRNGKLLNLTLRRNLNKQIED